MIAKLRRRFAPLFSAVMGAEYQNASTSLQRRTFYAELFLFARAPSRGMKQVYCFTGFAPETALCRRASSYRGVKYRASPVDKAGRTVERLWISSATGGSLKCPDRAPSSFRLFWSTHRLR